MAVSPLCIHLLLSSFVCLFVLSVLSFSLSLSRSHFGCFLCHGKIYGGSSSSDFRGDAALFFVVVVL